MLCVLAILAQGADAITMRFEMEANPLIVALGPTAYLAKIALILGVVALTWALPRLRSPSRKRPRRLMAASLSLLLLGAGLLGTASNLLASV